MAPRRRMTAGFNLGGEQAEADPLLELAFYESSGSRLRLPRGRWSRARRSPWAPRALVADPCRCAPGFKGSRLPD
jgi:hypothetical protein